VRVLVLIIKSIIYISEQITGLLFRVEQLLTRLLPALLPPEELIRLIRNHYDRSYQDVGRHLPETSYQWTLERWEEDVLTHHKMTSGTILVLGAGVGRESIALAQRGCLVVGLDINRESLCVASQHAMAKGVRLLVAQADFLAIPIGLARVDYVFMSGIMYSSIPGRQQRQAWLRSLHTRMNEHGLVVLNFLIAREMETRTHRLIHRLNRWLTRLPGTNQSYQLGDTCSQSHFLHAFVDEEEIRSELRDAGATVDQLGWHDGFAVLSWPS
jgi:ubiquinone/menaquinone biosynthesis C-methylase UbiE